MSFLSPLSSVSFGSLSRTYGYSDETKSNSATGAIPPFGDFYVTGHRIYDPAGDRFEARFNTAGDPEGKTTTSAYPHTVALKVQIPMDDASAKDLQADPSRVQFYAQTQDTLPDVAERISTPTTRNMFIQDVVSLRKNFLDGEQVYRAIRRPIVTTLDPKYKPVSRPSDMVT